MLQPGPGTKLQLTSHPPSISSSRLPQSSQTLHFIWKYVIIIIISRGISQPAVLFVLFWMFPFFTSSFGLPRNLPLAKRALLCLCTAQPQSLKVPSTHEIWLRKFKKTASANHNPLTCSSEHSVLALSTKTQEQQSRALE